MDLEKMNAIKTLMIACCVIGGSWGGSTQQSNAQQLQCQPTNCARIDTVIHSDAESQAYSLLQSAKSKYFWNRYSSNYWESFQDLDKAIELNPKLAKAYYARGLLREREFDKPEKALEDYNKALELDPLLVNAYYARGVFKLSRDRNSAKADFETVIKIDPVNSWGYYGLGLISGNIADFDQAIKLNPKFAAAYYQRGLVQEQKHNEQAAIADYQQAVSLNPSHSDAHRNLVILQLKTQRSLQTNPNNHLNASRRSDSEPSTRIQEAIQLFKEL
jgi:tetratricopeptide (TPR) repeat protein